MSLGPVRACFAHPDQPPGYYCDLCAAEERDEPEPDFRIRPRNRVERAAVEALRRRHPGLIVEVPR